MNINNNIRSPLKKHTPSYDISSSLPNMRASHWDDIVTPKKQKPFIIGVAGGTASGKTTVCQSIIQKLGDHRVAIISQDSFYKNLSEEEKERARNKDYNFDHPDAFDFALMRQVLLDLCDGKAVKIPTYDFVTHSRGEETTTIAAVEIILFEGILIFYDEVVCDSMNLKIFVDVEADTRLARRILRDIKHRGRDLDSVLTQYAKFVKPSFEQYIVQTKKFADVIIPRGADNYVAIDLIVQHIQSKLDDKLVLRKKVVDENLFDV